MEEIQPQKPRWKKLVLMCAVWFVLVAACMPFDRIVAQWVRTREIPKRISGSWTVNGIKKMGEYQWSTIPIAAIVAWRHRSKLRGAAFVLMTGLVDLLGNLIKWMLGRTRPYKLEPHVHEAIPFELRPFRGGWEGLWAQKNLAFPSGHTMVAFATAAALAILWPRWRPLFYIAAALVAAERVLENAHWLSDVVGAAGLAICGVHLMWMMTSRSLRPRTTIDHE